MNYLIAAVSTNMWQRQRDGDKSKRPPQPLRSAISDDEESKQQIPAPSSRQINNAEIPHNSTTIISQQAISQTIKKPHLISDITANLLFSATLLKAR